MVRGSIRTGYDVMIIDSHAHEEYMGARGLTAVEELDLGVLRLESWTPGRAGRVQVKSRTCT
jgi:hypothetical protein